MKRWLILGAAVGMLASTAPAQAANKLTMAGCGLGYVLFGKDNPNDKVLQILAVTTNGTLGNITFGITSGTLGCTVDGTIKTSLELEMYTVANFTNLSQEMAQGEGEFVNTFASLLGSSDATRPALLEFFQENYSLLFPSADTTPDEMLATLRTELRAHPELLG